jgi:hypothetical protein
MGSTDKFCWYSMFLSAVRSTSNAGAAIASNLPFFSPAQPCFETVETLWPRSNEPGRAGTDSSSRMRIGRHRGTRFFEHGDRQLTAHGREVPEKYIDAVAGLEVFEKNPHGHPGSAEHRRTAESRKSAELGLPLCAGQNPRTAHPPMYGVCEAPGWMAQ